MTVRRAAPPLALLTAVLLSFSPSAAAQDFGVALKAGTTGVGGDITVALSPVLNLRATGAWIQLSGSRTQGEIAYDTRTRLATGGGLLDFHPRGGELRLTAGVVGSLCRVLGDSTSSPLIVNGIPYSTADVGTLTAEVTANPAWPYVGIGLGNAMRRGGPWRLVVDLGVYYMGAPKVSLTANPPRPGQVPPGFNDDLEQERRRMESDLSRYKLFPVLSVGVSYTL